MNSSEIRFENLGKGITVAVSRPHTFGTDSILLAAFCAPKRADIACDLGTGCGILPLLWCRGDAPQKITGVDIQPEAVELCQRSIAKNNLGERFFAIQGDLRHLEERLPANSFDLVSMNPPYKADGAGVQNPDFHRRLARHETACSLTEIAKAASRLLKFGGRFCLCHRPERLCDIFCELRAQKIEPKRLRMVQETEFSRPSLVLVEGKKGAKPGLICEPALIIRSNAGYSDEMLKIYGPYREEYR